MNWAGCVAHGCLDNHDYRKRRLVDGASVAYNCSGEIRLGRIVGRYNRGVRHDGWLVLRTQFTGEHVSRVQHATSMMVLIGGSE